MTDQPKYQTLRDYLRVIRAQRWLIVLAVVVFGGAALAYSLRQEPTYEAEAALTFEDVTQDENLLGRSPTPSRAPVQLALIEAGRAERREVLEPVIEELQLDIAVEDLRDSLTARAEAQTGQVIVTAQAADDESAAILANTFAEKLAEVTRAEEKKQLRAAERSLRETFRAAERGERRALRELGIERGGLNGFTRGVFIDRISRLEALQDFGNPVQITRIAEAPAGPSSPNTVRSTLIGLILGLTIGMLLAFARDSLDLRLRSAREIQAHAKLPVLGHVGSGALGRAGVNGSNGLRGLDPPDVEGFRIIRTNLEYLDVDHPPKTIAVTSALPEEGKSTVAAALAVTYAQAGKHVLLVECDLRRPALAERFGINAKPGLVDYLAGKVGPQEVLQGVHVGPPANASNGSNGSSPSPAPGSQELVCITAGSSAPRPADILGSQRFRDFLEQVADAYDVVVLDTSPLLPVSDTLELLPQVDGLVLCVRANQTRREELRAARNAIQHLPDRPAGLVVTGIKPGDETDYGYYSPATYATTEA